MISLPTIYHAKIHNIIHKNDDDMLNKGTNEFVA